MSEWMDVEEVEAFKPILVSWGNRVRNNLYYLKNIADKAFLLDGSRAMEGNIVPALNSTYSLGSPQTQWKYVYVSGDVGEGGIKTSNTAVCENLNADMVDGLHAGNAANQVPISNGVLCSNLNADMLDGKHDYNFAQVLTYERLNSTVNTFILPWDIYHKILSLDLKIQAVCYNATILYIDFVFRRPSDGQVTEITHSVTTANLRVHHLMYFFNNDHEFGRFPYYFLSARDTGGGAQITHEILTIENYPAFLWVFRVRVNSGTVNTRVVLTYYLKT